MITLIDCDGVLSNWDQMFVRVCIEEFGIVPRIFDGKTWDYFEYPEVKEKKDDIWKHLLETRGLVRGLSLYEHSKELVSKLRERSSLICVTSIVSGGFYADERIMWLIEELGFSRKDIILAYRKYMVEGDVIIDDKPENVTLWADRWHSEGGIPILWQSPGKPLEVDDERVHHCSDVKTLISILDEHRKG